MSTKTMEEQLVVELTFTAVIAELRLTDHGSALPLVAMQHIATYGLNGVYQFPNEDGGTVTVTVEGMLGA